MSTRRFPPTGVHDAGKIVAALAGKAGHSVPVKYSVEAAGAVIVHVVDDGSGLMQGQFIDAGGHGRERIVDDPCVIAVFTQAFAQFLLHIPVVEQITHFLQGAVGAMEQLLR